MTDVLAEQNIANKYLHGLSRIMREFHTLARISKSCDP